MSETNTPKSILLVTTAAKGRGSGHLRRSSRLVAALRARGLLAYLWIHDRDQMGELAELCSLSGLSLSALTALLLDGEPESRSWQLVASDVYRCDSGLFERLAALGPLVGLDEGGAWRDSFDWLIDLLPNPLHRHAANEELPRFAVEALPRRSQPPAEDSSKARVLISFGGEDPKGLSTKALELLASSTGFLPAHIRLLIPPALSQAGRAGLEQEATKRGIECLAPTAQLGQLLHEFDLVITQFGITAFEALRAGTAVWTMSPGPVHKALVRSTGLPGAESGYKLAQAGEFERMVQQSAKLADEFFSLDAPPSAPGGESSLEGVAGLAAHLDAMSFPAGHACPVCKQRSNERVLARFPERSYRKCPRCKTVYMVRSVPPPVVYNKEYFFEEYRAQYGKTYLEDFPALRALAKSRLDVIERLLPAKSRSSLDIGCAYGPFLAEAAARGFKPCGIDAAQAAVDWVRSELKLPAVVGLFPQVDLDNAFGRTQFDLASLWYVIEHSPDLGTFLEALSQIIAPGGLLAFSTPSCAGISARTSIRAFLEASPSDHWTILDPRTIRGLLARYGFVLEKIRVTGHHPERFPLAASCVRGSGRWRFLAGCSRLFGLGDTFEVYARRVDMDMD